MSANYKWSDACKTQLWRRLLHAYYMWRLNSNGKLIVWNDKNVSNFHWESFKITANYFTRIIIKDISRYIYLGIFFN